MRKKKKERKERIKIKTRRQMCKHFWLPKLSLCVDHFILRINRQMRLRYELESWKYPENSHALHSWESSMNWIVVPRTSRVNYAKGLVVIKHHSRWQRWNRMREGEKRGGKEGFSMNRWREKLRGSWEKNHVRDYSIRCSKKRAIETGCIEVSYCKDFIRPAVLGGYNLSYQCKRDSR